MSTASDKRNSHDRNRLFTASDKRFLRKEDRWGDDGERLCRKILLAESFTPDLEDPRTRHTVACFENIHFFYRAERGHYDLLSRDGVERLWQESILPSLAGQKSIRGISFILPSIGDGDAILWSQEMPQTYQTLFGTAFADFLPVLFARQHSADAYTQYRKTVVFLLAKNCIPILCARCRERRLSIQWENDDIIAEKETNRALLD